MWAYVAILLGIIIASSGPIAIAIALVIVTFGLSHLLPGSFIVRWGGGFILSLLIAGFASAVSSERSGSTDPVASTPSVVENEQATESVDDLTALREAHFHGMARAAVILGVEPNKLRVGGREFRVKRNPSPLGGAFVYDPRDTFQGVTRNLVWWVPKGDVTALTAYPLNGPSKLVTPGLEFPARAGLLKVPDTTDVVGYVFRGEPMEP